MSEGTPIPELHNFPQAKKREQGTNSAGKRRKAHCTQGVSPRSRIREKNAKKCKKMHKNPCCKRKITTFLSFFILLIIIPLCSFLAFRYIFCRSCMYLFFSYFAIVPHMSTNLLYTQKRLCKELGISPLTFRRSWPDCPCVVLGVEKSRGKGHRVRYILEQVKDYIKQQAAQEKISTKTK